jgi:hypothetical protein
MSSISPGPVTLAGLMDPTTYATTDAISKMTDKQRADALRPYSLFPMYPTGKLSVSTKIAWC